MTVHELKTVQPHFDAVARREIARGRLEAFKVGDSARVSWDAIEKYKSETSVVPTATVAGAYGGRTHPAVGAGLSERLRNTKQSNDSPKPSPSLRERLGLGAPKRRRSSK